MKGLFYSPKEKLLFYIPPYYTNGTGMLKVLYKNLQEAEAILRQFQPISDIYVTQIYESRRYKRTWSFHTTLNKCPKEAFQLDEDWTMSKWIQYQNFRESG